MQPMQSVGVKVLKNSLSAYLREVAGGETVLVTDRGRVVAELVPPRIGAESSLAQQRWGDLVRTGVLAPAKRSGRAGMPRRRPIVKLHEVLRDLDSSRDGR